MVKNKSIKTICFIAYLCFFAQMFSICESFCRPVNDINKHLVQLINEELLSIDIAIYGLSDDSIINALLRARKRGVFVTIIVDAKGSDLKGPALFTKIKPLVNAGVVFYVYDPVKVGDYGFMPIMHNKIVVFGKNSKYKKSLAWTGSFNFSPTASKYNYENALFFDDSNSILALKQCLLDISKAKYVVRLEDYLLDRLFIVQSNKQEQNLPVVPT